MTKGGFYIPNIQLLLFAIWGLRIMLLASDFHIRGPYERFWLKDVFILSPS